nr:MAG TPA: hypothetical protein [Caudoviricetes sp.]
MNYSLRFNSRAIFVLYSCCILRCILCKKPLFYQVYTIYINCRTADKQRDSDK